MHFFFFFFFYALPIIISHRTRRPRVDAKRPPDVVDRFWRQNFILVTKLIAWGISIDASRRFCSVNLEQETAVTDRTRIYRVKIGHRRSATIRTRSFRSKKLFRFRRLSRQIALIGHFVTRSKLVRSQTRARYVSTAANSLLLFSTSVTNRKSWEKWRKKEREKGTKIPEYLFPKASIIAIVTLDISHSPPHHHSRTTSSYSSPPSTSFLSPCYLGTERCREKIPSINNEIPRWLARNRALSFSI